MTLKAMKLEVKKIIIIFYFSINNSCPIEAKKKPITIVAKKKLIHTIKFCHHTISITN